MAENCPFNITPLAQPTNQTGPNIISLNYTNQDFWSMKTRLINFLNERFGPNGTVLPNTFNDLVESSIAIMLIENYAFLADTLSFKMDQIVNELFIDTVTELENAVRLAKLVGFEPTPPISARTLWSATINNPLLTDIIIPTPIGIDIVSQDTPIRIELFAADSNNKPLFNDDIVIPAGSTVNTSIVGLEGRTITETFSGTGEIGQTLTLSFSPVIFDSPEVIVDGATWEKVDFFTDSQPRREFRVEYNSTYNAFIIFGNNRAGIIPSNGSSIVVNYRIGGGTVGNIVTGFVETQKQVFVEGLEFSVPITYRNYTKGEYGYDGDTIEDIRRKLPAWTKTQDRAVTGSDYKTLTDQFVTPYHGQVGKSTAVLRNYGCAGNIVDIYILAKDGVDSLITASNELKVDLIEYLNTKKMITDFICVRDGAVISTEISIDVTLDKSFRKLEPEIKENISLKTTAFFSLNNWEYGQTLKDSDLIKALSDIKQINSLDITFTTDDPDNSGSIVATRFFEIIRPDTINITLSFS